MGPLRVRSRTADRGWWMDEGSNRDPRALTPAKRHLRGRSFADVGKTKTRAGGEDMCG